MDLEKELDKLQDENAALRAELRGIDHKSMADTLERSNAVIAQYMAERDVLRAWKDNLTCNGEVGVCSYLVRDGGSMSFFLARGNCHEIIFDTLDCEKVTAERDALRKTMAVERKLWDECGDAQVRLTAERDEARAHYVAIVAERDALAAWKAAVPKTALLESLQLTASAAQYLAAAIWIESLDGAA